jgi:hypothetical protein
MRLEGHFESSSTLQRNERVKLAALLFNRQQHVDLFAYSTRRAPLGRRVCCLVMTMRTKTANAWD